MPDRAFALGARAAVLLLAIAAGLVLSLPAVPAEGQTATALVKNTGKQQTNSSDFEGKAYSQRFVTGRHGAGYTLSSIGVALTASATTEQRATFRAELWSESGGNPASKLADLTTPASIGPGVNTFTAPAGTTLNPRTGYYLVVYTTGDLSAIAVSRTSNNGEDDGAAANWTIANMSRDTATNTPMESSTWVARAASLRIEVSGYARVPTTLKLTTSATNDTAAENAGTVMVTATLDVQTATTISFTLTATTASTATAASDYTLLGAVTISAGQTTGVGGVRIVNDAIVEDEESIALTTSVSGLAVTAVTLTITDDDAANARIAFGTNAASTATHTPQVAENVSGGTFNVPITVSHLPSTSTTFDVEVQAGGTAAQYQSAQNPGDYRIMNTSVTFTATSNRTQNLAITITNDMLVEGAQTIMLRIADSAGANLGGHYMRHAMGRLATVTINDDEDDTARIAFGSDAGSTMAYTDAEDETGGSLTVPLTINHRPESDTTIAVEVLATGSNRATEGADYTIGTKSVTFTSTGGTTQNITVAITDDMLVEEDQTIRLRIADSATNSLGRHYTRNNEATLTITDDEADEAKIVIGNDATSTSEFPITATETDADATANVPVTISASPDSSITVLLAVVSMGTTATSADYTITTSSVTFTPTGSTTQNLAVTVRGDELVEEDQTVILRLADSSGLGRFYARHATSRQTTLTIEDDERPAAKIAFGTNASSTTAYAPPAAVDEDDGTINVPITITDLPESLTQFTVEVLATETRPATEYSAQDPGDYRVLDNKTVTFRPTDATNTQNVRIQLQDNALVEHSETVELRIVAADTTANDLGDHYDRDAQGQLATVTIDDDDAEAAEVAFGNSAGSMAEFTRTVREDIGGMSYSVPVTVSHLPSESTTFNIEVRATGDNQATEGTDYTIGTKSVTFVSPGATTQYVTITFTNDALVEEDQTIALRIVEAGGTADYLGGYYTRDMNGSLATVTIEDDEQRSARIAFGDSALATSSHRPTVAEDVEDGTLTVPVTINHLPESPTVFMVEVLPAGTATENTDYAITSKDVAFGPSSAMKQDLTITLINDDLVEGAQDIALRIVAADTESDDLGDHYRRDTNGAQSLVTITDDDAAVAKIAFGDNSDRTVTFRSTAAEPGSGDTTFNVPVTMSHLPESSTTIGVRVLSGLATETTDYSITTKSVTYQPSGSHTQNVAITLTADDLREGNETINLQLVAADNTVDDLGDHYDRDDRGGRASVLVTDPDSTATLRVLLRLTEAESSVSSKTVAEGGGPVIVYASLAGGAFAGSDGVRVTLLAAEGTTAAGNEYRIPSPFTIQSGANFERMRLTLIDDPTGEATEELVLTAATSPGYAVETATITITDDDEAGVMVPSSLRVVEGGVATYQVRLNTRPTASVTITPVSGDTNKATVSGPLTFTTLNWSRPQTVRVTGVDQGEGMTTISHEARSADPMFDGLAVNAVAVTVAPAGKNFSIASATVEEGGTAELEVKLGEAAPTGGLTLNLAYNYSGSPASTADTGTTPETFTVMEGSRTATLSVPIAADDLVEGPETFTVTISASDWSPVAAGSDRATVTITDDDAENARIAFGNNAASTSSQTDYSVVENTVTRTFSVPVTVSHLPQSNTTFPIQTLTAGAGRATEGADYTISPKSVTFGPSDATMTKNVTINIRNDSAAEGNEEVRLRIAPADNPANDLGDHFARHALGSLATLTIVDDDSATEVRLTTSASDDSIAEDGGSATVTATLDRPAPPGGVTVTLTTMGSAADPGDYTLSRTSLTIPPGATTATTRLTIVNDRISETDESVVFTGRARSNIAVYPVQGVTLTIADEDSPGVTVSRSSLSLPAGTMGAYTVRLDSPPTANVTITPTSGSTASATVDPPSLIFTPGNWSDTQQVTVTGVAAGSSTVTHAAVSSDTMYNGLGIASVAVAVNTPAKTLAIASATVAEGESVELAVTLGEPAPTGGLTLDVAYDYSGGAATADDTGTTPESLTVTEGSWTATLIVPTAADDLVEDEETFTVTISASGWSAASAGADSATVTITDADAPAAAIAFGNLASSAVAYEVSVAEDVVGGIFNLPVTVSHLPQDETTFEIEVLPGGTATGADYSIANPSVTFGPSDSTTKTLAIRITADSSVEAGETVRLRIAAADDPANDLGDSYARHAEGSLATVTITDSGGSTGGGGPTGGGPTGGGPTGGGPTGGGPTGGGPTGGGPTGGGPTGGGPTGGGPTGGGAPIGGAPPGGGGPSPSEVDFEWTVERDVEALAGGHDRPAGMQGQGSTVWLLQNGTGANDAVYVYDLETKERDAGREFALDEHNRAPRGIAIADEIAWVSDSGQDRLFAYDTVSGERLAERDVDLAARNRDARGLWIGEGVAWVLDAGKNTLFAYDLATGALLGEYALDPANGDPCGVWSDGVTVWVSDHGAKQLFAYRLPARPPDDEPDATEPGTVEATQASARRTTLEGGDEPGEVLALQAGPEEPVPLERVRDEEFEEPGRVGNNSPRGIWSDGEFMYVADELDGKVYSYNMPDAIDARLASLSLEGVEFGEFSPARTEYEGAAAEGVTVTVVTAEAAQPRTAVAVDPPDADPDTAGHQVALEGLEALTVTVTSQDGSRTRVYRVVLGAPQPQPQREPWAHCLKGAVADGFSLLVYEGGTVDELADCARSRGVTALYALHEGRYLAYILDAPDFVNAAFAARYPDGVPALTPLVAASKGPASEDPVGALDPPADWPGCLRGEVAEGFSLVLHEGGGVEALAECAREHALSAAWALHAGEWVAYIPGAPDFVNRPFAELFADGLPPLTPLVVRSDQEPDASGGGN